MGRRGIAPVILFAVCGFIILLSGCIPLELKTQIEERVLLFTGSPDYVVINAAFPDSGTVLSGFTGSFDVENLSEVKGSQTVAWSVYLSENDAFDVLEDTQVATGTFAALLAGAAQENTAFSGDWPADAGSYYLIIVISATDEEVIENNALVSGEIPVSEAPSLDYIVQNAVLPESGSTSSVFGGTFEIYNRGNIAGTGDINWNVFRSDDMLYDFNDVEVGFGSVAALDPETSAVDIDFNGTWPADPGTYYLVISISTSDTEVTANNVSISAAISVTTPAPDYVVQNASFPQDGTTESAFSGTFAITNQGDAAGIDDISWKVYRSTDDTYDLGTDTLLAGGSGIIGGLGVGASETGISFTGAWPAAAADYYLIIVLDANDEGYAGNNETVSPAITVGEPPPSADYVIQSPVFPATGTVDGAISGSFDILNQGAIAGAAAVTWSVFRSDDAVYDDGTDFEIDTDTIDEFGAGTTVTDIPFTGAWSSTGGVTYLIITVSASDDANTDNNEAVSNAIAVTPFPDVDYAVISEAFPSEGIPETVYNGSFQIENQGTGDGLSDISWTVYRSIDGTLETGGPGIDTVVQSGVRAALPGGEQTSTISFAGTWPAADASYWLFIVIESIDDGANGNDRISSNEIAVVQPPGPDYIITNIDVPVAGVVGTGYSGSFTVENNGTADGSAIVAWYVYRSEDASYNAGDELLVSSVVGPLATGASSDQLNYSGTWPETPATHYIIIRLSGTDDANTTNNEYVSPAIEVDDIVDYTAIETNFPVSGATEGDFSVGFRLKNIGTLPGDEQINWAVYYSADETVGAGDFELGSGFNDALAADGVSQTKTVNGTWPVDEGIYYLLIEITAADDGNSGNNLIASEAIEVVEAGRVVIVGADGKIMYSDNGGLAWTSAAVLPSTGYDDFYDVTTNGTGQWLACGQTQILYYSIDNAATWQPVTKIGEGYPSNELWAVAHHDGHWQVVGTYNGGDGTTYYSDDGINFVHIDTNSGDTMIGLTWDYFSSSWYSVSGTRYATSDDFGRTWAPDAAISGAHIRGLIGRPDGDKRLVGVGDDSNAAYSTDGGLTWTLASSMPDTGKRLWGVAYDGNTTWVTLGFTDGVGMNDAFIYTSSDGGVNWFAADTYVNTERMFEVAFDAISGRFIAVGNNGVVQYSTNLGYSWNRSTDPAIPEIAFFGIACGQ